ncbi:MAG: tetratricopeptide repeat protein [Spirochaetes bacterium]|nr:tetratricopeptide repeat protein [Spirochaetota bacterium]
MLGAAFASASETEALNSFSMGYYYLYEGELEMAKSQFKLALYHETDPPATLFAMLSTVCEWLGESDEAKEYTRRGLAEDPENEELLEIDSMMLLSEGKYEEAIESLKKLSEIRPYDVGLMFSLAEAYETTENEDGLIDVYSRMVKTNPQMVDAHLSLGYIFTKRGMYDDAEVEYEAVLEIEPENEKAVFYLTYIYLSTGRTDAALDLFRKLDSKELLNDEMLEDYAVNLFIEGQDPIPVLDRIENPDLLSEETVAIIRLSEGDLEGAKEIFETIVAESPGSITPYIGLIRIAERKNNVDMERKWRFVLAGNYFKYRIFDKALLQAERVKVLDPEFLENRYLLGDIFYALRRTKDAIEEFMYFTRHSEEKGDALLKLGMLYDEAGDHDKAIEQFSEAVKLFPENDKLYYYLGLEYRIVEDYKNAAWAFRKAIELRDDDPEYYFNLGVSCERMGKIEEAIRYLDRSVTLDDTNPISLNYLGYILADEGIRLEEAKDYIEKALSAEPDNSAYLDSMGWVYFKLAEYAKAKEYLVAATSDIDTTNKENYLIYEHLGDVYYVLGLFFEAKEAWQKALSIKHTEGVAKKLRDLEEGTIR